MFSNILFHFYSELIEMYYVNKKKKKKRLNY